MFKFQDKNRCVLNEMQQLYGCILLNLIRGYMIPINEITLYKMCIDYKNNDPKIHYDLDQKCGKKTHSLKCKQIDFKTELGND